MGGLKTQCVNLKDDSSAAVLIRLSTGNTLTAAVFTHIAAARKILNAERHIHLHMLISTQEMFISFFLMVKLSTIQKERSLILYFGSGCLTVLYYFSVSVS